MPARDVYDAVIAERGLRGHLPHRRGIRGTGDRLRAGRLRRTAHRAALRDLLPLAHRSDDPRPRPRRERPPALTLFGLHTPARLFAEDNDAVRAGLLESTLAQLDAHLAEPIADCLAPDADGRPCVEAKTPLDLERELRLPGGHIFHGDLAFPYAQESTGRWGVETEYANVLLCGAGAVRGGGVSGVPGHNAAMAALGE
ncbi:hypothetical protein SALBM135S_05760 [Streptomyces alboniger]